jgi:release factor glutamine methyltransferase
MQANPRHPRPIARRAIGRALKRALAWRYRRFRPGAQPDHWTRVAGLRLYILRGVFDPRIHFTSAFLAEYLSRPGVVRPGSSALDLGTGSGVLAIAAARSGAGRVMATDVNPQAVLCARQNTYLYALGGHVHVREGDLFASVQGERFDLIVCNPPYFRGTPTTDAERAYYAGEEYQWLDRFASEARQHVKPGGKVLVVLGDAADLPAILRRLSAPGWRIRQVARRDIWIEVLYVFEMRVESAAR